MARPQTLLTPKQQAIQDLATARLHLGPHWHGAAESLRPSNFIQQSIQKHRLAWAAGALITGFLAVRRLLPSSQPKNERDSLAKSAKKSGIIALIATPFLGLARKAVVSFITDQVQHYLRNSVKDPRPS